MVELEIVVSDLLWAVLCAVVSSLLIRRTADKPPPPLAGAAGGAVMSLQDQIQRLQLENIETERRAR